MDRENIQQQIDSKREIQEALQDELKSKQEILQEKRNVYSQSLVREKSGQRVTGKTHQASKLAEIQAEVTGHEDAIKAVESEIEALEKDLQLVGLSSHALTYEKAVASLEQAQELLQEAGTLNDQVRQASAAIRTLFLELENAVAGIGTLHKRLGPDYSLEAFLNGELLRLGDTTEDRDAILEQIGNKLKSFAQADIEIDPKSVQDLERAVRVFPIWQRLILGFQTGADLCKSRHSLQPRLPKKSQNHAPMGAPDPAFVVENPGMYNPTEIERAKKAMGIEDPSIPLGGYFQ